MSFRALARTNILAIEPGGPLTGPISVGFKQEFDPETELAFTYTAEPERIRGEIPSYMTYMGMPIGTHEQWLRTRTFEFAGDRERAKDFAGMERYIRQVIALEEKDNWRNGFLPFDLYCSLARALEQQGKKREAYADYQRAHEALEALKFNPGSWTKKQIDAGIARLKPH